MFLNPDYRAGLEIARRLGAATLLGLWYAGQVYTLTACAYLLSSAGVFLIFYGRIRHFFIPQPAPPTDIRTRFTLLIPAHNEARLLPQLLASIGRLDYPAAAFSAVVIADNCTDHTARLARLAGVTCLERSTAAPSDKAQALRYAVGALALQAPFSATVICIIDADCTLEPDYLTELDKLYARPGAAPVVQSFRSVSNTFASDVTVLDAAAEALRQWVLSGTRKLLGLDTFLFGLGCSMREAIFVDLMALPPGSLAEDKQWKVYLTENGLKVAYCPTARLSYEVVSDAGAFQKQRQRWLAGYYDSFKTYGLRMLRRGLRHANPAQLDLAGDLLQPPRSVLLLAAGFFGLMAGWFGQFALVGPGVWLGLIVAFGGYGALGLWLINARPRHYLLLFSGFRLIGVVVKAIGTIVLGRGVAAWDATRQENQPG